MMDTKGKPFWEYALSTPTDLLKEDLIAKYKKDIENTNDPKMKEAIQKSIDNLMEK